MCSYSIKQKLRFIARAWHINILERPLEMFSKGKIRYSREVGLCTRPTNWTGTEAHTAAQGFLHRGRGRITRIGFGGLGASLWSLGASLWSLGSYARSSTGTRKITLLFSTSTRSVTKVACLDCVPAVIYTSIKGCCAA